MIQSHNLPFYLSEIYMQLRWRKKRIFIRKSKDWICWWRQAKVASKIMGLKKIILWNKVYSLSLSTTTMFFLRSVYIDDLVSTSVFPFYIMIGIERELTLVLRFRINWFMEGICDRDHIPINADFMIRTIQIAFPSFFFFSPNLSTNTPMNLNLNFHLEYIYLSNHMYLFHHVIFKKYCDLQKIIRTIIFFFTKMNNFKSGKHVLFHETILLNSIYELLFENKNEGM